MGRVLARNAFRIPSGSAVLSPLTALWRDHLDRKPAVFALRFIVRRPPKYVTGKRRPCPYIAAWLNVFKAGELALFPGGADAHRVAVYLRSLQPIPDDTQADERPGRAGAFRKSRLS
jgi:hypothetical protein